MQIKELKKQVEELRTQQSAARTRAAVPLEQPAAGSRPSASSLEQPVARTRASLTLAEHERRRDSGDTLAQVSTSEIGISCHACMIMVGTG
jgi:hypothetical protein